MKRITVAVTVDLVPGTWEDIRGNGLAGYLDATYDEIVAEIGAPERYEEHGLKIDAEWRVCDAARKLGGFTIYNYKDGPNYLGKDGTPVEQITEWHIGGRGSTSMAMAEAVFGNRVRAA